jgi:hypothetical protein
MTMGDDSIRKRFPGRPPRIKLFAHVRPFYFVTFNTADRKHILDNVSLHQGFIDYATQGYHAYGVAVCFDESRARWTLFQTGRLALAGGGGPIAFLSWANHPACFGSSWQGTAMATRVGLPMVV